MSKPNRVQELEDRLAAMEAERDAWRRMALDLARQKTPTPYPVPVPVMPDPLPGRYPWRPWNKPYGPIWQVEQHPTITCETNTTAPH